MAKKICLYPISIELMEEGGYYAECPIIQGCHAEGETYAEVIENIQDVMRVILDSYKEMGKELPTVPTYKGNIVVSSGIPIPLGAKL